MSPLETEPVLHIALVVLLLTLAVFTAWDLASGKRRKKRPRAVTYGVTMGMLWGLTGIVALAWSLSGRSWTEMGFFVPAGWPGLAAWSVVVLTILYFAYVTWVLAVSSEERQKAQTQLSGSGDLKDIVPQSLGQLLVFQVMAVTAGITEEILFRAFLISVADLWLPFWAAGGAALLVFILAHAYQGLQGMMRLVPISVVLTLLYMGTGSILPGIVLHVLIDVFGGIQLYLLRHGLDSESDPDGDQPV